MIAWHTLRGPDSLDDVHLVGARSPASVHVVLALDESGSFADYDSVRSQVLNQLISWGSVNLRSNDTLTVIAFSGTAGVKMPTTTFASLAEGRGVVGEVPPTDYTYIKPALIEAAGAIRAAGAVGQVSLIVLTDTIVRDAADGDQQQIDRLMTDLGASTMSVITPDGVDVESNWSEAFPYELTLTASVGSADQTALSIGEAMAHATGQELKER